MEPLIHALHLMMEPENIKFIAEMAKIIAQRMALRIANIRRERSHLKNVESILEAHELRLAEHEQRIYERIAELEAAEMRKPVDPAVVSELAKLSQLLLKLETQKTELMAEQATMKTRFQAQRFALGQRFSYRLKQIDLLLRKVDLNIDHIDKLYRDAVRHLEQETHDPILRKLEGLLNKLRREEEVEAGTELAEARYE